MCINLALLVSACETSFDAEPAPQRVVSVNGRRQRSRSPCPELFAWRTYRLPSRRHQAGRLGRRRLRLQLPPHCRMTIPQTQRLRQHRRLKSQDCWWKPTAPHRTQKNTPHQIPVLLRRTHLDRLPFAKERTMYADSAYFLYSRRLYSYSRTWHLNSQQRQRLQQTPS